MVKICLNMIVRNEAKIILRCLENLINIIDFIVITDTGSTDSTIQIIKDFMQKNKIPGKVYQDKWVNFGINRSKSIVNAKDYLIKYKTPLEKVFLLFIDADMIIEKINFQKSDLNLDYYLIKQYNNHISYYNIRLAKASLNLEYKSVTHEYLDIKPDTAKSSKLSTLQINDIGDGGCKTLEGGCSIDKFQRDIKLLTQGIIDEPDNSRYYFYLAQSYKDSGDVSNATKYYEKRSKMGGWIEEICYSYLMLGQLYYPDSKSIEYFQKSFDSSGLTRAEPLYWLAKYYSNKEDYKQSYNYLVKALKLKYPDDQVLFINDMIYNVDLFKELAIVSFYVNKKQIGLLTCDYVKFISKESNEEIKQIQKFYLKQINSKSNLLNQTDLPETFNQSNCCFKLVSPGICEGIIRTINYKINSNGLYIYENNIQTENYWCVVDINTNQIIQKIKIELQDSFYQSIKKPHSSNIKGLEDGRFIIYKKKLYASFVSLEYGYHPIQSIVLAHINPEFKITHLIPLRYNNNIIQKNWLPIEYDGKLCFIYSYDPFILLHVNVYTGFCSELIKSTYNYNFSTFRGSAGPITIGSNKQLVLVHEVAFDTTVKPTKRTYLHRFLEYDNNFHLLRISEPFYFNKLGIEFSLTLMYCPITNNIIIYHTIDDSQINKIEIQPENINWLPFNLKENILSYL